MIDEKKLIEDYDRITFTDKIQKRQIKDLIEHLIELQPKVGEWIPCSERLPEDETTKIVTLSNGKVEGAFWNERNWWCMGDSINLETRTEDVIAWMPLPTPYKEDMRGVTNE